MYVYDEKLKNSYTKKDREIFMCDGMLKNSKVGKKVINRLKKKYQQHNGILVNINNAAISYNISNLYNVTFVCTYIDIYQVIHSCVI